MGIAVPVTKSEVALARKIVIPAKSSGKPQRFAGVRAMTRSFKPSICVRAVAVRSVSIHPGRIALTCILSFPQAAAKDRPEICLSHPARALPPKGYLAHAYLKESSPFGCCTI